MPDIELLGATYSDVPAVDLPKSGGGMARFTDLTGVNYAGAPSPAGNADQANAILYGTVDGTSTSTAFTATVAGLDKYVDGTCVMLKNGVVTSAAGFTIDVNSLGAKPVYSNMAAATADTTIFNVNYTMLFVYDSTRVEGGCWICYRGYNSDNNTIGYQLRTNSTAMPAITRTRYYRLLFTSADGTKWVPANTTYDNSATSVKTPNSNAIDPFGRIVYMSGTTNVPAGSNVGATVCWSRYALNLGYSFNTTGSALVLTYPAPVYVQCTPNSDGSATMVGTVQALPSSNDGKIYIFLGMAYSETNIELYDIHPVYWHDGTGVRLWTGATYAASTHAHGDITSGGDITAAAPTIASGDKLVINDESASKITNGPSFGTDSTKFLCNDGTWSVPPSGAQMSAMTVSLISAGWSSNQKTLSVPGVTESSIVIVTPAPASVSAWDAAGVYCSAQGNGTLTFTRATTQASALTVNIVILTATTVLYTIIIASSGTVDKNMAEEGETVTVTTPSTTPGKSKKYYVTVTDEATSAVLYTSTGLIQSAAYTFTMPAADVRVTITAS